MNRDEAKQVLLLYRPGTADAEDPEIVQAMAVAREDHELAHWFEQHRRFQVAMREKFRQIQAPEHLKMALLAQQRIIHPVPWWQRPAWLSAAAAVIVLLGALVFWPKPPHFDRFADYQEMMISMAVRGYDMDWRTPEMNELRSKIQQRGAPADYAVPPSLEKLKLTGGAAFPWRSNPVAMVCFDRGDSQMVFLFVIKRAGIKDPPPSTPKLETVNKYMAASWTSGDKTYVLAGPKEAGQQEFLKRYL
jgi:uncharacterized membrane protein YbaN (DUF454 family)